MSKIDDIHRMVTGENAELRSRCEALERRNAELEKLLADRSGDVLQEIIDSCKTKPASAEVLEVVPTDGSTKIRKLCST